MTVIQLSGECCLGHERHNMEIFSAEILSNAKQRRLTHHGCGWLVLSWGSLLLAHTDGESWMPAMLCLGWDYLESSVRTVTRLGIRQTKTQIIACNHNPEVSSCKCVSVLSMMRISGDDDDT